MDCSKIRHGPLKTGLVFFDNQINSSKADQLVATTLPPSSRTTRSDEADFRLILTKDHLQLQLNQADAPGAIQADFIAGKARHRLGQGEMIVRAMGLKKLDKPNIIDTTAGLGRDAFVLASKGCNVTLIEQSPVIYLLLHDALNRAAANADTKPIVDRMSLVNAVAEDYLDENSSTQADIIYLDPMYPERKKSALVKKEMQIFQKLLGKDSSSDRLLSTALSNARYRVVVKRPLKGVYLNGLKPDFSTEGKSVRFDVYLTHATA